MPPVSRFGGGGARAKKKQTVIDKLKAFFERFFGIGGSLFTDAPTAGETINYAAPVQDQSVLKVAEEMPSYGEKKED